MPESVWLLGVAWVQAAGEQMRLCLGGLPEDPAEGVGINYQLNEAN